MGCFKERGTRVEVITLGCKVNQADSREIMAGLSRCGYRTAAHWERPDLVVINTCAVTMVSEAKGRKEIGRAMRRGARGLVVTGCMAEVSGPETRAIPGVDLVVGREDRHRLPELVRAAFPPASPEARDGETDGAERRSRARAFIKVQDGCGRRCAYCIVPLARGGPVSLDAAAVSGQVGEALGQEVREVVLCGINLGGWRGRGGEGLSSLLEEVLGLGEGFRVRLSSLDPEDLESGMFAGLEDEGRLCPHFHLPLQSGSDAVLERMGRGYRAEEYLEKVEELRSRWDDPAITTDVMVGFPGESEADFDATLETVGRLGPSKLHVFRYSPRPGTQAASMDGQVPEKEKRRRADEVSSRGEELAQEYALRQAGKVLEVMVEKMEEDAGGPKGFGTTGNYIKAEIRGGGMRAGGLYDGVVTGTQGPRVTMTR